MGWWSRLELTAGLRPQLKSSEKEILVQSHVGLYEGKSKALLFQDGRVYLTSRRLCYVDSAYPQERSLELSLSDIESIDYYGGFMRSSAKIIINVVEKLSDYDLAFAQVTGSNDTINGAKAKTSTDKTRRFPTPSLLSSSSSSKNNTSTSSTPASVHGNTNDKLNQDPKTLYQQIQKIQTIQQAQRRRTKIPLHEVTWICPICYFSNHLPNDFEWPELDFPKSLEDLADPLENTNMPPCSTCGIRGTRKAVFQAIEQVLGVTKANNNSIAIPDRIDSDLTVEEPPYKVDSNNIMDQVSNNTFLIDVLKPTVNNAKSADTVSVSSVDKPIASDPDGTDPDGFPCPRCTFINHPSLNFCEICGARLVSAHLPPQLNRVIVQDIDTISVNSPASSIGGKKKIIEDIKNNINGGYSDSASSSMSVLQYDEDGYIASLLGSQTPADSFTNSNNTENSNNSLINKNSASRVFKLSFRSGGDKQFYEALKQAINKKEWLSGKTNEFSSSTDLSLPNKTFSDGRHQTSSGSTVGSSSATNPVNRLAVGIHGLQLSDESKREKNRQVLGAGLEDLNELMNCAKDLVKLAEDYARFLEQNKSLLNSDDSNGDTSELKAAQEARRSLAYSTQALGLSSAVVTKELMGSDDIEEYYAELARQIAEFLTDTKTFYGSTHDYNNNDGFRPTQRNATNSTIPTSVLDREGGIITLFDLFAVYNRARGVSLISPKDLYNACNKLQELKLPITLRRFKSGLNVVQESYKTPEVIIRNLVQWMQQRGKDYVSQRRREIAEARALKAIFAESSEEATVTSSMKQEEQQEDGEPTFYEFEGTGVTAMEVSTKFKWSVMIATEELEMAEERGVLCRDEQLSGTVFYENYFLKFPVWNWKAELFGETCTTNNDSYSSSFDNQDKKKRDKSKKKK